MFWSVLGLCDLVISLFTYGAETGGRMYSVGLGAKPTEGGRGSQGGGL